MTNGFTDSTIIKLKDMGCVVHSIQLPFILFSIHNTFYKCKMNIIIKHDSIYSILRHSKKPLTIKDLK